MVYGISMECEKVMKMYEIGEKVFYRGKEFEVADRLGDKYALWSCDKEHKHQVKGDLLDGFVAEEELFRMPNDKGKINYWNESKVVE